MWANLQETTDLVTFTNKILNGKLHILYSVEGHWKTTWGRRRLITRALNALEHVGIRSIWGTLFRRIHSLPSYGNPLLSVTSRKIVAIVWWVSLWWEDKHWTLDHFSWNLCYSLQYYYNTYHLKLLRLQDSACWWILF